MTEYVYELDCLNCGPQAIVLCGIIKGPYLDCPSCSASWAYHTRRRYIAPGEAEKDRASASVPEPAPKNEGEDVTAWVLRMFKALSPQIKTKGGENHGLQAMIALVEARRAFGIEKYGQPLMSQDGRDTLEDLRQEIGDAVAYTFKALISGEGDADDIEQLAQVVEWIKETLEMLAEAKREGIDAWEGVRGMILEAEATADATEEEGCDA